MAQQVEVIDEPQIGTASWMVPPQVNNVATYRDGAIWLGRNADDARTPIGRKDESHVLLCAMNRSGKGRALITNNLLLWKGSAVINDPKGENASVTAARRGQGSAHVTKFLDQKVCVLDGHNTSTVDDKYRAYYNVLNDLDPDSEDTPSLAKDIAESCVTENVKKDPTWDEMAIPFMQALLLQIITAPKSSDPTKGCIPENERDLVTFRRMIQIGDFNALRFYEHHLGADVIKEKRPNLQEHLLERMRENPAFDGIISDAAESLLTSLKMQPKLWNSVRQAAETATAWIDDPKIRKVLRSGTYANTFKASEIETLKGGVSVYVCLRLKDQRKMAAWPRIVTNMVLAAAQDDYHRSPATGHQTLLMLDEFASLERMKTIEDAISAIAGAGIKIFMVLQNLTQLKATYGDNWEAFMANAGTQIYYGFNDNFSADYMSKRLGEIEVIRTMQSGSTAFNESQTVTETEGGGKSSTTSQNTTNSTNYGSSHGGGSGSNSQHGSNSNSTHGWGPALFGVTLNMMPHMNTGSGSNKSHGQSSQSSWQKIRNKGRSTSTGTSETNSENWSRAVAEQRGRTDTQGWAQTLHKKPLAAINELMKLFGTVEDTNAPNYPGIGLISMAEHDPLLIQKSFYDLDTFFRGMFDPHPKWGIAAIQPTTRVAVSPEAFSLPLTVPEICLNSSRPRYTMEKIPALSKSGEPVRIYHDKVFIEFDERIERGGDFKKGDVIGYYTFAIHNHPSLYERFFEIIAPSDGRILSVNDYGFVGSVDGEDVILESEKDRAELEQLKQNSRGQQIGEIQRDVTTAELELAGNNEIELRGFFTDLVHAFLCYRRARDDVSSHQRTATENDKDIPKMAAHLSMFVLPILGCAYLWQFSILLSLYFLGLFGVVLFFAYAARPGHVADYWYSGRHLIVHGLWTFSGQRYRILNRLKDEEQKFKNIFENVKASWPRSL